MKTMAIGNNMVIDIRALNDDTLVMCSTLDHDGVCDLKTFRITQFFAVFISLLMFKNMRPSLSF